MPPAVTIDDVITQCGLKIANLAYVTGNGFYNQNQAVPNWIAGMFSQTSGIFPPSSDQLVKQRVVTNWLAQHKIAQALLIPADFLQQPDSTSAVIDAVFRVANAVKFAVIDNLITVGQQNAVIALFNTTWT